MWYMLHVAMEDPETQENGFVLIVYPKKCTPEQIDRDVIAKGTALIGSIMPLLWKGFHICHPCSSYNKYFPLVKMLSPASIKDNIAVHFGTDEHVLQCMATYSVPAERLPKDFGGGADLDYKKWIADRKEAEGEDAFRAPTPQPESEEPESSDEVMEDAPASSKASGKGSAKASAGKARSGSDSKVRAGGAAAARSSNASVASSTTSITSPSPPAPDADSAKSSSATAKTKRPGRKGDNRMHRAVTLKLDDPEMSLVDALQEGGFTFEGLNEKNKPHHEVFDQDGVSLMQRKNQLLRRIRVEKKKKKDESDAQDE